MNDLTNLDLDSLNNIDPRLIPSLKNYFEKIKEKENSTSLDYTTDKFKEDLITGNLSFLICSTDKNSPIYREDFDKLAAGMYIDRTKEILINIDNMDALNQILSHESEHYITSNYNNGKSLTSYSIIGEPATEIGAQFTMSDNTEQVKEKLLEGDCGYSQRVRFLLALNEATGNNIEDLINANRQNDLDFFLSLIPKKYLDSICSVEDHLFWGKYIKELDSTPAKLISITLNSFKDYIYDFDNSDYYPNMDDYLSSKIDSLLEGYEEVLEHDKDIENELFQNELFLGCMSLDFLDEETLNTIISRIKENYEASDLDIEFKIYEAMLRSEPDNPKCNSILAAYTGYSRFQKYLDASMSIIGDNDFFIADSFDDFLEEVEYVEGLPYKVVPNSKFKALNILYRDKETGIIRKIVNGKDVTDTNNIPIPYVYENSDSKEVEETLDIIGKKVDISDWKNYTEILSKNLLTDQKFINKDALINQITDFKVALDCYRTDLEYTQELSDEQSHYIDIFEDLASKTINLSLSENEIEFKSMIDNVKTSILQSDIDTSEIQDWMNKITRQELKKDKEKYKDDDELSL